MAARNRRSSGHSASPPYSRVMLIASGYIRRQRYLWMIFCQTSISDLTLARIGVKCSMSYDFRNLSSADFEDLVRDLIGKEEGLRFEAFCAGPDGGIDGRHAHACGNVVLQAKHYEGSPFSKLTAAMKRERSSIDRLAPTRYILATSSRFTPLGKSRLSPLIGGDSMTIRTPIPPTSGH